MKWSATKDGSKAGSREVFRRLIQVESKLWYKGKPTSGPTKLKSLTVGRISIRGVFRSWETHHRINLANKINRSKLSKPHKLLIRCLGISLKGHTPETRRQGVHRPCESDKSDRRSKSKIDASLSRKNRMTSWWLSANQIPPKTEAKCMLPLLVLEIRTPNSRDCRKGMLFFKNIEKKNKNSLWKMWVI